MGRLQTLFSESWAVRRAALDRLMAVITPCITAGNPAAAEAYLSESPQAEIKCMGPDGTSGDYSAGSEDLPSGTIAVYHLSGMLYRWETADLSEFISDAEANPSIAGVVLVIDGPGGMAGGVPACAQKISSMTKPVATVVAGEMCSAHLWLGTSARRVFVTSEFCEIGSIGAMTSFISYKEFNEKNGIIERDIYPDTSDLKNKDYRDLEENGDDTAVKSRLEKLHRAFATQVAKSRGIEADMELPIFRGEVVDGNAAIEAGLADQMGDIDDALEWVMAQSVINALPDEYKN